MTSADIGLIILRERRMKLSLYDELNDPFELLSHALGDKLMRRAQKALKEHFTKTKVSVQSTHLDRPQAAHLDCYFAPM
ncbi:hypothetical protein [Hydrogenophaga sp. PBC]|uniref:hypothetical protein n=1 Tax=Hydrogenophaga sp. PBC TaxID=795665 RepID=UPI0011E068F8|nr:hypothetical protein [Hydrogenophaga sp. PBC]